MKRINLKNILLSLVMFSACSLPGLASAGCDSAYWGINTHSSSSLGGLVVTTTINGALANMNVTVGNSNWAGSTTGVVKVTSSYAQGTGYSALNWNTGSTYYCATQSSACANTGYLVLGNGSSNSQGNTYALDCKNNAGAENQFYVQMISGNPSPYGYWQYSISSQRTLDAAYHVNNSGDNANPIVYFTTNNGYTTWLTYNWVTQSPPSYALTVNINPAGAATATGAGTYTQGTTATAGYSSVSASYSFSSWSGDAGCGSAMTMNAAHSCTANFTLKPTYTLNVNINPAGAATATGAGTYIQGTSATAGYTSVAQYYSFSSWSGDTGCGSAMTMNAAHSCTANFNYLPPSVSCTVSPQSGLSPLVAKVVPTLTNTSGGTFDYDMNNDGVYEYTGKAGTVYYTYSTAGTYTVKVRHSTGLTATCGPGPVTVSNPSSNSGGEVRP